MPIPDCGTRHEDEDTCCRYPIISREDSCWWGRLWLRIRKGTEDITRQQMLRLSVTLQNLCQDTVQLLFIDGFLSGGGEGMISFQQESQAVGIKPPQTMKCAGVELPEAPPRAWFLDLYWRRRGSSWQVIAVRDGRLAPDWRPRRCRLPPGRRRAVPWARRRPQFGQSWSAVAWPAPCRPGADGW